MRDTVLVQNIRAEMIRMNLNANSLASAAGLKTGGVRDILDGRSQSPKADTLTKIATALGRTVGELLGIEPMGEPVKHQSPRLPPQTVKDQEKLQLLLYWEEMDSRAQRVILGVMQGFAAEREDQT